MYTLLLLTGNQELLFTDLIFVRIGLCLVKMQKAVHRLLSNS